MQGARHGFINGKQDVKATEKHSVECIVLLTLWFIILSCLGRCNKRPSHNILFNRSIVHAISLHVLGVDQYVFFRADADTDYYRSSRPITDILNRYTCLV